MLNSDTFGDHAVIYPRTKKTLIKLPCLLRQRLQFPNLVFNHQVFQRSLVALAAGGEIKSSNARSATTYAFSA